MISVQILDDFPLCTHHLAWAHLLYQEDGDERGWHYDGTDFVATLMLQQASGGGAFEYAPFIRGELLPPPPPPPPAAAAQAPATTAGASGTPAPGTPAAAAARRHDERFERVRELFEGSYAGEVLTSRVAAGTVNLFNGRRTLHRVEHVADPTKRAIAILS